MSLAIYALGILLVLIGAVSIAAGIPIIYVEQGWTEIIAGTIALSAGCVIAVLGVVVTRLEGLRSSLQALGPVVSSQIQTMPADVPPRPEVLTSNAGFDHADAAMAAPAADEFEIFRPEPAPATFEVRRFEADLPGEQNSEAGVSSESGAAEPVILDHPTHDAAPEPSFSAQPPLLPPNEAAEPLAPARRSPVKLPGFVSGLFNRRKTPSQDDHPEAAHQHETYAPDVMTPVDEPVALASDPLLGEPPVGRHEDEHRDAFLEEAVAAGYLAAPDHATTVAPSAAAEPGPTLVEERRARTTHDEPAGLGEPADLGEPLDYEVEARPPPLADHPLLPSVVGRYNAGSASYVMYSNGMIEVETETGVHQFESMQELKAFIEQQEAAGV